MSQLHHLHRLFSNGSTPKKSGIFPLRDLIATFLRAALFVSLLIPLASCEKKGNGIVDSIGSAPQLTKASISPSRINSDSINVGSNRQPDDLITITSTFAVNIQAGSELPLSVTYSITSPDSMTIVSQGDLLDDGLLPDRTKGDGSFTASATFQIKRVQVGTYVVRLSAESSNGYGSNMMLLPLTVFRGNRPPVINDLIAPDTVKLGNQSQLIQLAITASDSDGLTDVTRVVFSSFKPNGTPSGGNPYLMYDDGLAIHGDAKAGDGIFSLIISLPSNTEPGSYRFEFQAFDRSNEPSNVIITHITVVQ